MVPEDLLFWISPINEAPILDPPVLCRRHADLMSVPRGWTLDDRRERFPRLFRPRPLPNAGITAASPTAAPTALQKAQQATQTAHPHHGRRRRARADGPEQLVIDGTAEIPRPALPPEPEAKQEPQAPPEPEPENDLEPAWRPEFDTDDDLDGLLKVQSPLLARAFGGTGRKR